MKNKIIIAAITTLGLITIGYFGGYIFPASVAASSTSSIGWMHGNCIALRQSDIKPGTGVTVVRLDVPQRIVRSTITGPAKSGEDCYALKEDRKAVNVDAGNYFYHVPTPRPVALGIGIVHPVGADNLTDAEILDIDHSGAKLMFMDCATSEGAQFSIWKGEPYKGKKIWSGYYYLGYDVEATCPENEVEK